MASPIMTTATAVPVPPNVALNKQPSTITIVASDKEKFVVELAVIRCSNLLANMIDDLGETSEEVPVQITSPVLKKILEWCSHHQNDPRPAAEDMDDSRKRTTDISEWDQKFIAVDQEMLFEIILGANYLDIKALLDVGCKTVANMIKGKSPEEIRNMFNITKDFTDEEEEQIRRENEWAEDR